MIAISPFFKVLRERIAHGHSFVKRDGSNSFLGIKRGGAVKNCQKYGEHYELVERLAWFGNLEPSIAPWPTAVTGNTLPCLTPYCISYHGLFFNQKMLLNFGYLQN